MSNNQNSNKGALLGAAFIMATSAIGPGFLTQTATFTGQFGASFWFVFLASILLSVIIHIHVWKLLCLTGLLGQDVSNKLFPGYIGIASCGARVLR